ncbi:unnamed protein product, partial [marine sediment metagenome]
GDTDLDDIVGGTAITVTDGANTVIAGNATVAVTAQSIGPIQIDTTSSNIAFDDAFHVTTAEVESLYMSKQYIDDAAAGLAEQGVKGDHIDSTSENFVFDGAYHYTSEDGVDSMFMSKQYIDDVAGSLTEEEVEDFVGGMLGGTETNITATYNDEDNDIDFVVDSEPWDSLGAWGNHVNVVTDSLASWANKVNTNYDHSQDNTQAHSDYVLNSGSDVMGGTLTADGLTLGQDENITLGSQTLDHNGTDFVFNDDVTISGIIVTSDTLTKGFVIQAPD